MFRDDDTHENNIGPAASGDMPVQCCPFCGESLGVFWGRRGDDGSHWCEPCGVFFRVELA
jgi:hypothetical protein